MYSKLSFRQVTKRELLLVDRSEQSIRMTLWGKTAETFTNEDHPVLAFRGVKVGDYGGLFQRCCVLALALAIFTALVSARTKSRNV